MKLCGTQHTPTHECKQNCGDLNKIGGLCQPPFDILVVGLYYSIAKCYGWEHWVMVCLRYSESIAISKVST